MKKYQPADGIGLDYGTTLPLLNKPCVLTWLGICRHDVAWSEGKVRVREIMDMRDRLGD